MDAEGRLDLSSCFIVDDFTGISSRAAVSDRAPKGFRHYMEVPWTEEDTGDLIMGKKGSITVRKRWGRGHAGYRNGQEGRGVGRGRHGIGERRLRRGYAHQGRRKLWGGGYAFTREWKEERGADGEGRGRRKAVGQRVWGINCLLRSRIPYLRRRGLRRPQGATSWR